MYQGISELIIAMFSFPEKFSMNISNHVTPCVLTCVIYRKSYYRKLMSFPMFFPDVESSARATVGEQWEQHEIPLSVLSSVFWLSSFPKE